MQHRQNSKRTYIYWLFDVRPQTIAANGVPKPFYCGKTCRAVERRLSEHCANAKRQPTRRAYAKILECGPHIRIDVVEIIEPGIDWVQREIFWIDQLKKINKECVNSATGGAGSSGAKWTVEQRAALSKRRTGRTVPWETRIKIARSVALARGYVIDEDIEGRLQRKVARLIRINQRRASISEDYRRELARLRKLARKYRGGTKAHQKRFAYLYLGV